MPKLIEGVERSILCCKSLPLAVYREVAAHLQQVEGVETGLIPQQSQQFDYNESQIGGLWIQFSTAADATARERVEQILAYYSNSYAPWQEYNYQNEGVWGSYNTTTIISDLVGESYPPR